MSALRVMTFNVQLLPWIADATAGMTNDAPERADRAADAIEGLAPDERPHVIAFNEVFDEDGRARLKSRLSGAWPNVIEKIDDGGVLEDSGLMLFSTVPFVSTATGFFDASAGADAMSNKGFGIVQINEPVEVTTLVFSHLQASYATEDEHRDVRLKQFDQIRAAVDAMVGTSQSDWRNVVLIGDLNVRGDGDAATDEWTAVFEQAHTNLFERLDDDWRIHMHPPGDPTDQDRGLTNIDYNSGLRQRLDYVCTSKPVDGNRHLVAHQMCIRIKNASDHFALEGVIQQASPACTPDDAIDALAVAATTAPSWPSSVRPLRLQFAHEGSRQWVWVKQPGTYTVFPAAGVEYSMYSYDDLSTPLQRLDTVHIASLPPAVVNSFREARVSPLGGTFVSREPFYIVFRTRSGAPAASTSILFEHRGESPETAIWLRLHDDVDTGFPSGQQLGSDDVCWFKARPEPSYGAQPRLERFVARNGTGNPIRFSQHDEVYDPISSTSGADAERPLDISCVGDELILLSIARSDIGDTAFSVRWSSPMSYLVLAEPLGLYVNDESGPDWAGDDEIIMSMSIDGRTVLHDAVWDDADTGERWPGLAEAIRQRAAVVLPGKPRVGFHQDLTLSYIEDDFTAQGFQLASLTPLGEHDPASKQRLVTMPVPDGLSDGRYTFYCTIAKHP
jgi:hypothetical protein